jgi:hypothetical protein
MVRPKAKVTHTPRVVRTPGLVATIVDHVGTTVVAATAHIAPADRAGTAVTAAKAAARARADAAVAACIRDPVMEARAVSVSGR